MVWTKVDLPQEINHKLKILAAQKNISMSRLVYDIIIEYMNNHHSIQTPIITQPPQQEIAKPLKIRTNKVKKLAKELGLNVD